MEKKLVMAALLIAVAIGVWRFVEKRQEEKNPHFANTEDLISYACDHAVAEAQKYDGITLDYSIDSIKKVDTILGRVHDLYVKNPSAVEVRGISLEYGAYVGEVIRRNEPGTYWTKDSQVAGEKSYPLHWNSTESYPLAWCSRRIINGDEDLIWIKYTVIKQRIGEKNQKPNAPETDRTH
jgi:hypothetical protein